VTLTALAGTGFRNAAGNDAILRQIAVDDFGGSNVKNKKAKE